MALEQLVNQHYAHASLEQTILGAAAAAGKDVDHLEPADLAPVDEFHIGGRQATADFARQLPIRPGMQLLEIGSGLGGASRYLAHEQGCRVAGVDLTEDYVRVADALAARLGLSGAVSYRQGSALDLPFGDASFDGAYMIHVGMNIADKAKAFAEVRRVLKPGGFFGIFDVMREAEGPLGFPMPWASTSETSFVESPAAYRRLLEGAGFRVQKERSRQAMAVEFCRRLRAQTASGTGPPMLGLHIVMGAAAPQKIANMIGGLEGGLIAPVEMVAIAA